MNQMLPSGWTTTSFGELSRLPSNLSAITVTWPFGLVARHAPAAVLARELPALEVEGVAVAVAGRVAEGRDPVVVLDPAQLRVGRDVAPDHVAADAVPGRALGPRRAEVQPLDQRVEDHVLPERRIERDDVGVRVHPRLGGVPGARRRRPARPAAASAALPAARPAARASGRPAPPAARPRPRPARRSGRRGGRRARSARFS